jgi:hypothetical protein
MTTLHEELLDRLGDPGMEQIAEMLGSDQTTARTVLEAASGTIVGGLAHTTDDLDGAEALRSALEDHADADPFNGDVASLTRDGQNILGHVLGGRGTEEAAAAIARLAGLRSEAVMRVLPLTAPMIMTLVATRAAEHDMDAADVAVLIGHESADVPGGLGDMVSELLTDIYGEPVPHQGGGRPRPGAQW